MYYIKHIRSILSIERNWNSFFLALWIYARLKADSLKHDINIGHISFYIITPYYDVLESCFYHGYLLFQHAFKQVYLITQFVTIAYSVLYQCFISVFGYGSYTSFKIWLGKVQNDAVKMDMTLLPSLWKFLC